MKIKNDDVFAETVVWCRTVSRVTDLCFLLVWHSVFPLDMTWALGQFLSTQAELWDSIPEGSSQHENQFDKVVSNFWIMTIWSLFTDLFHKTESKLFWTSNNILGPNYDERVCHRTQITYSVWLQSQVGPESVIDLKTSAFG